MTRAQLEHIIRAAGVIADSRDVVVIGSQAVLGQFPNAPEELLVSNEADVFPLEDPRGGELIDGSIGEGSPFQRAFGYYAHGVDDTTAILPTGWRDRLILVTSPNTEYVRGWCLEIHDLAIGKYVAGREKDLEFTATLAQYKMVSQQTLEMRLEITALDPSLRTAVTARIQRSFRSPT